MFAKSLLYNLSLACLISAYFFQKQPENIDAKVVYE